VATQFGSFNLVYPILQVCLGKYAVGYIGIKDIDTKDLIYKKVVKGDEDIEYGIVNDFDLILTGTSPSSDVEYNMWRFARDSGKDSICILDMTKHCQERFYKNGELFLPDMIFVVDEEGKEAVSCIGVAPDNIIVTGSPYLDAVCQFRLTNEEKEQVRGELKLGRKRLLTFCTEYIAASGEKELYGYDEFDILRGLSKYIRKRGFDNIRLRIRLHPKDESNMYEEFFKTMDDGIDFEIAAGEIGNRFFQASDAVIGMTSTILTEAHMLGLHVVSFQPAGKGINKHVHNSIIEKTLVTTIAGLYERLDAILDGPHVNVSSLPTDSRNDSLNKIMEVVDSRLRAISFKKRAA